MSVEWTTPAMKAALQAELNSQIELRDNSAVMKTQEGREIMARMIRLTEVLVDGEAKTPLPIRHHE